MSITDPCKDLDLEPLAEVAETVPGQNTPPTIDPDLDEVQQAQVRVEAFYVSETIDPHEPVNSADRTISMVNEEYFISSPIPQPAEGIRTATAIIKSKRSTLQQLEMDYFRASNLSMWYQENPLKFLNTLNGDEDERRDLGIPFDVKMGATRTDDSATNLDFITMFDVTLDAYWTKFKTENYRDFRNQPGIFFDVYMYGKSSAYYDENKHREYRFGLFNTMPYYCDSVFEAGLPISEKETQNLHSPGFNVVDISLSENRVVLSDKLGNEVRDEYQIPSLYEIFNKKSKSKKADNDTVLTPNNSEQEQAPSETVHKFTSDKVELFTEANSELEYTAANSVSIAINTKQDNTIAQFLRNTKMDRHLLDLISPINNDWPARDRVFAQVNDETIYYKNSAPKEQTLNDRFRSGIRGRTWMNFEQKLKHLSSTGGGYASNQAQYPLGHYGDDKPERLLKFEDAISSQIFLNDLRKYVKQNNLTRTFAEILEGKKAHSEIVAYHVEKINANTNEVMQDFYFSDSGEVLEINFIDTQIITGKKYIYRVNAINFVIATDYAYRLPNTTPSGETQVAQTAPSSAGGDRFVAKDEADENQYTIIEIIYDQFSGTPIKATVRKPDGTIAVIEYTDEEAAELLEEKEKEADNSGKQEKKEEGTSSPSPGPTLLKTKVTVLSNTRFNIIETPFFEKQITVFDKPPMFPQVTFLPYQGKDDKISVLLQSNAGRVTEEVVKIKETDREVHDFMAENQGKTAQDKLGFGSDSLPTQFEVLVLDYLPTSYQDFKNSRSVRTVATGKTGFVSFSVEPNKQYYFCFRAIDDGGISNPTEVFRARMVSYQNGIFLDMEAIELRKPRSLDPMYFQKIIKIEPAFRQRALAFPDIDLDNVSPEQLRDFYASAPSIDNFEIGHPIERNLETGEDKGKVWDKNFKLRIKSKTTSKKIDINFKFKREKKLVLNAEQETVKEVMKLQKQIRKATGKTEPPKEAVIGVVSGRSGPVIRRDQYGNMIDEDGNIIG